jgi:hypothetical protein
VLDNPTMVSQVGGAKKRVKVFVQFSRGTSTAEAFVNRSAAEGYEVIGAWGRYGTGITFVNGRFVKQATRVEREQ